MDPWIGIVDKSIFMHDRIQTLPVSPATHKVKVDSPTSTILARNISANCVISVLAGPGGALNFTNISSFSVNQTKQEIEKLE